MGAAVQHAARFHTMPDNLAPAVLAHRRERMDGAFKAIKEMRLAVAHHFDGFVVIVPAHFSFRHNASWPRTYERQSDLQPYMRRGAR